MTIENLSATFIALVVMIGACIVIAVPIVFIAYECKRFYLFLRRACSRRRLNAIMSDLKPMDQMIRDYYGGAK